MVERKWSLNHFANWLTHLSNSFDFKNANKGLWELPLYESDFPQWQKTEYYTKAQFFDKGGIKYYDKLLLSPQEPWFNFAMDLKFLGLSIYRFRLLALAPNSIQHKHVDQFSDKPIMRVHLPLLTHSKAFLDYYPQPHRCHRMHLKADGHAYLINVTKTHRVCNLDNQKWRLHLVGDIRSINSNLKIDKIKVGLV